MPKKNTGNAAITENADTGQGEMLAQGHDSPGLPEGGGEGARQAASESSPITGTGKEKKRRSSRARTPKKNLKADRVAESKASPEVVGGKSIDFNMAAPAYTRMGKAIQELLSCGVTGDQILTGAKEFCR